MKIDAIHAFYLENRQELYTYAFSITRNRESAEDAIQSVFERLLRSKEWPSDLRPYLFRAVRNATYDWLRRGKVRTDSQLELSAAAEISGGQTFESGQADDLAQLLDRLTSDERESIILKTYSGLTFQQIAELRGVPLPTVASWYRRGIERLKTMVAEER